MKITVKVGICTALISIVIRYGAFTLGLFEFGTIKLFVFLNMFLLTSAVSIGLFIVKKNQEEESNLLLDIKTGMTAAMPFTLLVSCFLFIFYSYIHPEYNEHQIKERMELVKKPTYLNVMRKEDPESENKTDQELIANEEKKAKVMYTPKAAMIVSLLGMLVFSTFNSIFISLIYRKIIFKNYTYSN